MGILHYGKDFEYRKFEPWLKFYVQKCEALINRPQSNQPQTLLNDWNKFLIWLLFKDVVLCAFLFLFMHLFNTKTIWN